ncbi:Gfo/Idh/MocA family oxidoreductase [Candidatus Poribacteria bacterium]|nr:Gfo/Idh/MocA family oxidoreductase [Candidatus Poribacteria bacterium]
MSTFKIGIIGSGGMARHHLQRFSSIEKVGIVAITSRNRDTGTHLADEYKTSYISDWQQLLDNDVLEGIVICTHNDSHGEIALKALESGKHVFVEYPLANNISQAEEAINLAKACNLILRVSHPEVVSNNHQSLKKKTKALGDLLLSSFTRLTPRRGTRPEILFNLSVSGIPAHFFIYHIYPIVDLFGEPAWVEGAACYEGLTETGQYNRFVNTVTIVFKQGGIGQWSWAGGIDINESQQHQRYVLTNGSLINDGDGWYCSTVDGVTELKVSKTPQPSLQELWLTEIQASKYSEPNYNDVDVALSAIKISLAAEQSIQEDRRIEL